MRLTASSQSGKEAKLLRVLTGSRTEMSLALAPTTQRSATLHKLASGSLSDLVSVARSLRCGVQKVKDKMLAEVQGWCRGCRGGAAVQGRCGEGAGEVQVVQGGCRLPAPSVPQQA